MKKKYIAIIILLGSWAKSYGSDVLLSDSPGSMRHDLQDADGEWELVAKAADASAAPAITQEEQKKEAACKKPLAEKAKLKIIKMGSAKEIDAVITAQCSERIAKSLQLGALLGGKEVDPLAAAQQVASKLEHHSKLGTCEISKRGAMRIACMAEERVFPAVFKDHPEALQLIKEAKIDQALRLKNGSFSPCDDESEEDEEGNGKMVEDPSILEEASSDDESEGPGLFKLLKNMANFFAKRGNESE